MVYTIVGLWPTPSYLGTTRASYDTVAVDYARRSSIVANRPSSLDRQSGHSGAIME